MYKYSTTEARSFTYRSASDYQANVHECVLKGLKYGRKLYYRIGDGDRWTRGFSTLTSFAPVDKETNAKNIKTFKFLSYGDMDVHESGQDTLRLVSEIIKKDPEVRFVIHQGDIPYAWSENKWDQWGNMAEPLTSALPYMTTVGNHEENHNFTSYKNRFSNMTGINSGSAPNGNLFYSFDYSSIHFVALSSEHEHIPGSTQYRWLENDLKRVDRKKTPFLILYAHRPMYCSNKNHGSSIEFRDDIEPLLHKYQVDLFLFGHVHAYERTCPMTTNGKCSDSTDHYH